MAHQIYSNKFQYKPEYILLSIPEAGIEIFPNFMLISAQQTDHKQNVSISCIETSEGTGSQYNIEETKTEDNNGQKKPQKICVSFNNSNFAFQADDGTFKIQIHNLSPEEQEVKGRTLITIIKFTELQSYMTVYALLQKKLCELGFDKKYRIKQPLGKGATAEVYLAERISDKKLFAAKIISIKKSTEKAYVLNAIKQETFINESKLLRVVNHKNIVRLEGLYVHKKQLIQVMEYLSGGHLLKVLKNNQLKSVSEKWQVLHDMLLGLEHLRQKRIIHRDLKLENILIRLKNGKREYVISDFGLAIWAGENHPLFFKCGTPGYIAPEVLASDGEIIPFTHASDIFSLGVIAHLIFLHRPLFPYNGDLKELLRLNRKARFSLKSELYNHLSRSQYTFLQYCLAKNPQQRPNSRFLLINFFEQKKQVQKSHRQSSSSRSKKILDGQKLGVKIKTEKQTSINKNNLSLDIKETKKKDKSLEKNSQKSRPNSARKFVKQIFDSFLSPKPKRNELKVKENSQEKHKKMLDFVD